MSDETCILTTKDLTILEVMLDGCPGRDDRLAPILRKKINSALIMFRDDVPENVATLSSRVAFSVDGKPAETRIISHEQTTSPTGMFLSIASPRGLALLGLVEGQEFRLTGRDGSEERILLEEVLYQPEAVRRARKMAAKTDVPQAARSSLRLVSAQASVRPKVGTAVPGGFDDPGPSAA